MKKDFLNICLVLECLILGIYLVVGFPYLCFLIAFYYSMTVDFSPEFLPEAIIKILVLVCVYTLVIYSEFNAIIATNKLFKGLKIKKLDIAYILITFIAGAALLAIYLISTFSILT